MSNNLEHQIAELTQLISEMQDTLRDQDNLNARLYIMISAALSISIQTHKVVSVRSNDEEHEAAREKLNKSFDIFTENGEAASSLIWGDEDE